MKMTESRGIPATYMTTSLFHLIQNQGFRANGMSNARRTVMDHALMAKAEQYTGENNRPGTTAMTYLKNNVLQTTNYPDMKRMQYTGLANLTALQMAERALTAPLTEKERNPQPLTYNDTMLGFGNDRYIKVSARSYAEAQLKFNKIAMMNAGSGYGPDLERVGTNDGLGFYGNFGDGLPLIAPTDELVAEMLAGSERGLFPNDVLGWLKFSGGAITVEKVAINAVMAGAKPEHFPVILAAAEILANGWDNDKMWYHGLGTGSDSTLHILINGPLGKELGISGAEGSAGGAGNTVNNIIGRAIRMCIRNFGHIIREVDDHQYKGREHDHVLITFREEEEKLPGWDPALWDGNPRPTNMWAPYHVEMGFRPEQSTITIWAGNSTGGREYPGEPFFWANARLSGTGGFFGTDTDLSWLGYGMIYALPPNAMNMMVFSPGMAQAMYDVRNIKSKDALRATTSQPSAPAAGRKVGTNPIVAGGDLAGPRLYGTYDFYNRMNHQIQLISGATLTQNGRSASAFVENHVGVAGEVTDESGNTLNLNPQTVPTPAGAWMPSSPQNIKVNFTPANIEGRVNATLTWDKPVDDGNSPIIAYQLAFIHGGPIQFFTVTDASTGSVDLGNPQSLTYVAERWSMYDHITVPFMEGLDLGIQTSGGNRIYAITAGTEAFNNRTFTFENLPAGYEAFFRVRAISGLQNALEMDGAEFIATATGGTPSFFWLNDGMTARASGRGAWGLYDGGKSTMVEIASAPTIRRELTGIKVSATATTAKIEVTVTEYVNDVPTILKGEYTGSYVKGTPVTISFAAGFTVSVQMKGFPAIYTVKDCSFD